MTKNKKDQSLRDQSHTYSYALGYEQRGWCVIPVFEPGFGGACTCERGLECESPGKHPRVRWGKHQDKRPRGWEIEKWWGQWPDSNIGIVTGKVSGIAVVDVDPKNGGGESLRDIVAKHGEIPPTVTVITGGGGIHYYFAYPDKKVISHPIARGIDIKGEGGLIIAPPSVHYTDNRYRFKEGCDPDSVPLAPLPLWVSEIMETKGAIPLIKGRPHTTVGIEDTIPEGTRHMTLVSLGGAMRNRGLAYDAVLAALIQENSTRCAPPLPEGEVESIAQSVFKYGGGGPRGDHWLTDTGLAERLIYSYGGKLRYVAPWKRWIIWDNSNWRVDETGGIERLAKQSGLTFYYDAAATEDGTIRKEILKAAKRAMSGGGRRVTVALATTEPGIPVLPEDLDRDPWLLNCANGTLDLRTGDLLPFDKGQMLTLNTGINYQADAQTPRWGQFLAEIMDNNQELIDFLQRVVGYALTGDTSEQALFVLHGTGNNGKTTFLQTLRTMLGDYAAVCGAEAFMERYQETVRNDLAALRKVRMVCTFEMGENRRVAETLVKQVTGGEPLRVRFLYSEFFEYTPEFKIFLAANHKPQIRGTDLAIWRRVYLVPFNVVIPAEKRDKRLLEKLRREHPGILRWSMEGCKKWQAVGLNPPEEVTAATDEYKREMDPLGDFLAECCVIDENGEVPSGDLYRCYEAWYKASGGSDREKISKIDMGRRLSAKGLDSYQETIGRRRRMWIGLRLPPPSEEKYGEHDKEDNQ